MIIGILALQGAFIEHKKKLDDLNVNCFYIRNKADLEKGKDGIILPGGESTAMHILLRDLDMLDLLKKQISNGLPTFGTCAGLILLAKKITNQNELFLECMDVHVTRNGYGRQQASFMTRNNFDGKEIPMTFIRAPFIESVSKGSEVLSTFENRIVAAKQHHMLVTSFHPELSDDFTVHNYFLEMIKHANKTTTR